ncbi:hypothetical protein GOP47_0006421 [Adiantum capillus-veneris]|uniref:4-coumarate--CoA ligase n=1 Tax=Adiantum capillus-veneris TaxID=13818 RepID=A0A9D4V2V1_ADICA|nr:hypothetical protein GOP47_0006421 [Adiantum capillus-veneris]
MDHSIDENSGFCAVTGIFHSKRARLPVPSTPQLSLPAFLQQQSCGNSTSTAYIDFSNGSSISYAQLHAHIKAVAAGLALLLGLRKGDVLLLLSPNSIHFVIFLQAALSIGVVITTSNPVSLPTEISHQVEQCAAKCIATTAALVQKVADLHLPLILLGDVPQSARLPPHVPLSRLITVHADSFPSIPVYQEDTALLLFSSGTTGTSKGVILSHKNLIAQAVFFINRPGLTGSPARVYLCFVPMFHAYGLAIFSSAVLGKGFPIVLLPKFDMVQMLLAIQNYKVTYLPLVPPVLLALAKSSLVEKYDLSSLREISVGAAPVSKDLIMTFKARFPDVVVLQGYGLTESAAVGATILTAEESREFSSVGLLSPNTEAKIVHVDSGSPLPPNHSGEIWLRGPTIMKGYLGQPEATASTVDKEGWLRTGDLGYINSNGFCFIIDRLKELIKYKGFQVAPAELEDVLLSHPLIQDAAVVPHPDEEAGQIPVGYIVVAGGATLSAAEAIDFVAERVAPYKKIRKVSFVRSIPKTPSGKILRRQLIAKAGSKL